MKECFSLHLYQSAYSIQDYKYEEKDVGSMIRFVIYLLGLASTVLVFKKARRYLFQARYLLFFVALIAGMVLSFSIWDLSFGKVLLFCYFSNLRIENPLYYGRSHKHFIIFFPIILRQLCGKEGYIIGREIIYIYKN